MATGDNGPRIVRLTFRDGDVGRFRSRAIVLYYKAESGATMVYVEGTGDSFIVEETPEEIDKMMGYGRK